MNRTLDDDTTEALLAGRAPMQQGELALLREFVDVLRSTARGPVPAPSAALASLLEGAGVRQPTPLPVASAGGRARTRPRPVRALAARVAAAGLVAKVGLGVSMAAASVGGAAAAGVPVAEAVVEAVTPVEFGHRHQVEPSVDRRLGARRGGDHERVESRTRDGAELEVGDLGQEGAWGGNAPRLVTSVPAGRGSERMAPAPASPSAHDLPATDADRPTTVEDDRPGNSSAHRDRDEPGARARAAGSPGDASHGPPESAGQRRPRATRHGRMSAPAFGRQ